MRRVLWFIVCLLLAGCSRPSPTPSAAANDADASFSRLADEYLAGYLAWRPQTGTALGFHLYDGKVTDYTQASLHAELARLKSFDQRLSRIEHGAPQPPGVLRLSHPAQQHSARDLWV